MPDVGDDQPWLVIEASGDSRFFGSGASCEASGEWVGYGSLVEDDVSLETALVAAQEWATKYGVPIIWVQATPQVRHSTVADSETAGHNVLMAYGLTKEKSGWRLPVLAGVVGVTLFIAGVFSRLTNPPFPLILSAALGGLGLFGLGLYLQSDARDREERLTGPLGDLAQQRLRKHRPLSIVLTVALIVLTGFPFALSFFARSIDALFYNGVIGLCLIGMVVWSIAAAIGHTARHTVLDEHERALVNADAKGS